MYTWSGPETELGTPVCVATGLTVNEITELENGAKKATGELSFMDYAENIEGHDRWEAFGSVIGRSLSWIVVPVHAPGEAFWFGKEGKPMFTASSTIDEGIVKFIKEQLVVALGPTPKRQVAPVLGKVFIGVGDCCCGVLRNLPMTFEMLTRNARIDSALFLSNCITCSCGRNWWQDPENGGYWVPVADAAAWLMLLNNDGKAVRSLGILHDGVYLLQTLRDRGLIPL